MSELQGTVNTENELKFLTDEHGLEIARTWADKRHLSEQGVVWFDRSHIFYDTDALDLMQAGWAFRKKVGAHSYCLKYPVANEGPLLVRREIFIRKLPFALDFQNPLHRRTPVMARIVDLLRGSDIDAFETAMGSIQPRIRIDCVREYFFSVKEGKADRSIGMALDRVVAVDVETGDAISRWCEVELETGWGYVEETARMVQLGDELEMKGLQSTTDTKYQIACRDAISL